MKIESTIPFSGFYGSVWDSEIDACEDGALNNLEEDWDGVEGFDAVWEDGVVYEILNANTDHRKMHEQIAAAYVEQFADELNEEFGFGVGLVFKELNSPREYNFTTDRIFVEANLEDIVHVYRRVGRTAVAQMARYMFTSRSGFISFYSPDIKDWGSIREWDYNQLGTIFAAAHVRVGHDDGDRLEALQETIRNIYDNNVDWDKVERELQHKIDVQNGEV